MTIPVLCVLLFAHAPAVVLAQGPTLDCNGNGVADALDLQNGTSTDCNGNGVPDECDLATTAGSVAAESAIGSQSGGFNVTLQQFDRFGRALAQLGDLNGDGIGELVVGVPGDDDGGTDAGAVYVLYMNALGEVVAHVKLGPGQGGFSGVLASGDRFGESLAVVGDVNLDGVPDLAVGAPGTDDGGSDHGAVWILYLSSAGTVVGQSKISSTAGSFVGPLASFDFFGSSVAALGDVDGNTVPDLAVGARGSDLGGMDRGVVWTLLLGPAGGVLVEQQLGSASGGFLGTLNNEDAFGSAVAMLGDLDGNGTRELAVGARLSDDGATDAGAVWIVSLSATGTAVAQQKISATQGNFSGALTTSDAFGSSLAAAGDLNGDTIPDLIVGAPLDDDGGTSVHSNRGAVWVLTLQTTGSVLAAQKVSHTSGGFGGVLTDNSAFGVAVAKLDDLDGDGLGEVAVGSVGDFPATSFGTVWVLFTAAIASDCNGNGVADACDLAAGTSVDLDGDGFPDECFVGDFVRGDCNADGSVNLTDPVYVLGYLFPSGTPNPLLCLDACDGNDDGGLSLPDAIVMLNALFGQPATPLPAPTACAADPTADGIGCAEFATCP
ncbi:MAG: hypothetical protein AAF581_17970 [Planctomycetota bacterium]